VGAGLSLASAIPFIGWGGTAAKAARRGANMASDAVSTAAKRTDVPTGSGTGKQNNNGNGGKAKGRNKGACDHLRQGSGKGPYRGGAHDRTSKPKNDKKDSHHMPAKAVSPLAERDGPAIQMDPSDHKLTSSHGNRPGHRKYQQAIKGLIDSANWRDAMAQEIRDIRRIQHLIKKPRKYNEAMLEMLEYFKCLNENRLLP